jgi:hypothetical protein
MLRFLHFVIWMRKLSTPTNRRHHTMTASGDEMPDTLTFADLDAERVWLRKLFPE